MKKSFVYLATALALCLLLLAPFPAGTGRAQTDQDEYGLRGPRSFSSGSTPELRWARNLTWRYLEDNRKEFGLDRKNHMKMLRAWVDESAMAHVRVQQTFGDVPVFRGELIVHWNTNGTLSEVTNSWVSELQTETTPNLTQETAVRHATARFGCSDCLTSEPEVRLWVLRHEGVDRLAYQVSLRREDGTNATSLPVYFVDAHTGEIFWDYDNLQTATGSSLYSGTVSFDTFRKRSGSAFLYFLEDLGRNHGTYNYNSGTTIATLFSDTDDNWDAPIQQAAVDVHYGTSAVLDYYKNVHGRNGLDGMGGPVQTTAQDGATRVITSRVHYGSNFVNAFWNGSYMTYGDGDGSAAGPLVTLDIIGHEMTHGVTEHTADLVYSGETGALNESISDVFAAMIERYANQQRGETGETVRDDNIWKIAEDCWTPATPGDALRHLNDPHRASNVGFTADDDPDHYSERYTGQFDNSGVHVNSGIPNKAFYLLAQGGTHHRGGSMVGIGPDAAAKIWYKALTTYLTSGARFIDARRATESAAAVLYGRGSQEVLAVRQSWCLVGVGICQPTGTGDTQR